MRGILLALAFLLAELVAHTVITSLPAPFVYFPLMLTLGVVIMNRASVPEGVTWILLAGFVAGGAHGDVLTYAAAGLVGAIASLRIFATRSVYALLGLALTVGMAFLVTRSVLGLLVSFIHTDNTRIPVSINDGMWTMLLLLAGVYGAFVIIVMGKRWFKTTFIVRDPRL